MVCLFFVVSGYALSTKPLRLLHTHTHHATSFAPTLSSLVFRRSIRLFLPPAISTLLIVALLRAGLYEHTRPFATSSHFLRNVHETHYHRLPSLADQLADWARTQWDFIHVWDWKPYGGSNGMDVHLWTIPVEFRCSMLLFLSLLGTASLRPTVRLLVVVFLATFCYFHGRWDMLLFYAGMFLAEVDNMLLLLLPVVVVPFPRAASSSFAGADDDDDADKKWIPISLVGLYLMSQPDQGSDATPGWVRLSELIPEWWPGDDRHRYFQCFGAVVFVGAVGRSPAWRRILNSGAVQYLGRISYAMYLMHGPVMHTLGYAVQWAVWTVVGTDGLAYNLGFAVSALIIIPLVVCISDIFWRAVDAPTVRFAKWVESKCVVHE
ncbi:acyltransferase 3 [Echria macrotheca]|uniref:Acyltransferase 3 n=1 Tax=Echria macrotheca TaxID=438768 RepID=A0AAJ0F4F1_9PEZI|nr:acyltransferase 3 [Echria macrotheca]